METSIESVPVWALCYLINGDSSGLTKDEIALIDNIVRRQSVELVCTGIDEVDTTPYFSNNPWFGLPGDVMDCTVVYRVT